MEVKGSTKPDSEKAIRILAKSVYRTLKAGGYTKTEIVSFTSEVIGLLTSNIREGEAP